MDSKNMSQKYDILGRLERDNMVERQMKFNFKGPGPEPKLKDGYYDSHGDWIEE